ncbi:MAG: hypothetical protein AAF730_11455 [Bacteroidota bacterium]
MHTLLKRSLLALSGTVIAAVVYVLLSGGSIDRAADLMPALVVGVIVFALPTLKRDTHSERS